MEGCEIVLTLNVQEKDILDIIAGDKTFEVIEQRDRNFHVGQYICLKHSNFEFDKNRVTHTMIIIKIKYITEYAQNSTYVVFSFDVIGDVMIDLEELK